MHLACLTSLVLGLMMPAGGDEPTTPITVVTPKDRGIVATAINAGGDVVGFEWVEEKDDPGMISEVPFFARGKAITRLPLLEGYTTTLPAAVSDEGLVVGRAGKPVRVAARGRMSNQAFVWDAKAGIRGLGVIEGDSSSFATGISRDGTRISGVSVGRDRVRACVWDRDGERWAGAALPQDGRIAANVAAISGEGTRVAGAVDGVPTLWTRAESGAWTRDALGAIGAMAPRAVNDAGTVVGLRSSSDGRTHAVAWSRDTGCRDLGMPEGYVNSEALAINNRGAIAGMMDGPRGSKVGPDAFVSEGGPARAIRQPGLVIASATAINDRGQVAGVIGTEDEDEPKPDPGRPK